MSERISDKAEIFVRYDKYGYVAKSPGSDIKETRKCSGPREAADAMASAIYGKDGYTMSAKGRSRKVYEAARKAA